MASVIEALKQEHSDLAELLRLVEAQANAPGKPDYGLILEIVEYLRSYTDRYHHPKEDLIYRALCRRDPRETSAITDLEAEHEELAKATDDLGVAVERARRGEGDAPDAFKRRARLFVDFYRQHIGKEEQTFFPKVERALLPEDWTRIEAQITDPTDPLFREKAADRLSDLLVRTADVKASSFRAHPSNDSET